MVVQTPHRDARRHAVVQRKLRPLVRVAEFHNRRGVEAVEQTSGRSPAYGIEQYVKCPWWLSRREGLNLVSGVPTA